jgi:hypothetical protein
MQLDEVTSDRELLQVLWACYDSWERQSGPEQRRVICYTWIVSRHRDRFGARFHQAKLSVLARTGLLEKAGVSRGGRRRYYRLPRPRVVESVLADAGLL